MRRDPFRTDSGFTTTAVGPDVTISPVLTPECGPERVVKQAWEARSSRESILVRFESGSAMLRKLTV